MKILKIIVFIVLAIVAMALITALFAKKEYAVQREIVINKPKAEVFEYIKYLKNQNNFSKWASLDPKMEKTFTGVDATVGFVSAWSSKMKEVGKGEQEITKITDGERIDYELRFLEPMQSTEHAFMTTTAVNDSTTKVVWGFDGKMKYPSNLMMLFMSFDEMIGGDFEVGLKNLKEILETPEK